MSSLKSVIRFLYFLTICDLHWQSFCTNVLWIHYLDVEILCYVVPESSQHHGKDNFQIEEYWRHITITRLFRLQQSWIKSEVFRYPKMFGECGRSWQWGPSIISHAPFDMYQIEDAALYLYHVYCDSNIACFGLHF